MLQGPKTGETAIKTGGIIPNLLLAKPRGKYLCEIRPVEKYDCRKSDLTFSPPLFLSEQFFSHAKDISKILFRVELVSKDVDRGTRYIESSSR